MSCDNETAGNFTSTFREISLSRKGYYSYAVMFVEAFQAPLVLIDNKKVTA